MPIDNETKKVTGTIIVQAPASEIFELLARPARHAEIDGSDMVQAATHGPDRLHAGAKFGMNMKFGALPYKISNQVVTFEEGREIAWRHFGHHVWRYELEAIDNASTKVTETFDWGVARVPKMYEVAGYPAKHDVNIAKTLERLAALFA